MKIVIADDSGTARMFTKRCLEICDLGDVEFIEAENGKEALDLLKAQSVDLLITDLTMPVMDGVLLIKHISASPRLNGLPVMVITSADNPAREEELRKLGAGSILPKPVNPAMMMEALEEMNLIQGEENFDY